MYAYKSLFPPIPSWLPALFAAAVLFVLGRALEFNGLFGQDSNGYVQQTEAIYAQMTGHTAPAANPAGSFNAYALVGALLRWVAGDAMSALQLVSWLSAGLALWFFDRNMQELAPGARMHTRLTFSFILLFGAPAFLLSGLSILPHMLSLSFMLGAIVHAQRVVNSGNVTAAVLASLLAGLACSTQFSLFLLLVPPIGLAAWHVIRYRKFAALLLMVPAGLAGLVPILWPNIAGITAGSFWPGLSDWSFLNFFRAEFSRPGGSAAYLLPNVMYVFFPLAHPAFCLVLPGLWIFTKKTDWRLPFRQILMLSLLCYLFYLAGLPQQDILSLLPAFVLLLLLLFPAWDRLVAYGEFFYPRVAFAILGITALTQLAGNVWLLWPLRVY